MPETQNTSVKDPRAISDAAIFDSIIRENEYDTELKEMSSEMLHGLLSERFPDVRGTLEEVHRHTDYIIGLWSSGEERRIEL